MEPNTGYHSISFGTLEGIIKNTWLDWHLIPTSRPTFPPPPQKTQIIDIPGADGVIDLSSALTGKPVFGNREGSWEFFVIDGYGDWVDRYSEIMNYLHGKRMSVRLEDDWNHQYDGRFTVENWDSANDGTGSKITIAYSVAPYKINITTGEKIL